MTANARRRNTRLLCLTIALAALLAACGTARSASPDKAPPPIARPVAAPVEAPAPVAASASDAAPLSADEREVLAMYDEMISSFMTHSGDCGQMASAVDAAAAAHSPALLRVQAGLAALPADRYSEAQLRLEHTQGPKLVVMRQAMQKAVMSCGQDQRLVASLMRLSNLGKPSP